LNPCRKVGEAPPDTPIEIVSGGAEGVDTIAIEWAKANHLPVNVFPADWSKHGKSAGPIRNAEMAKYADALICIRWDYSKGSKNMAELMIKANKPVIQYILPKMPLNMLRV
jgi:hypothetical protein